MRSAALLILTAVACQPQLPRYVVSELRQELSTSTLTKKQTRAYVYAKPQAFADLPLASGSWSVDDGVGDAQSASVEYSYSEQRLHHIEQRSSSEALQSSVGFMYTRKDQLLKIETDSGQGGATEVNIEVGYDEQRANQIVFSWSWLIFNVNERCDVVYDERDRIAELDGGDFRVMYTWSDRTLDRVEVQNGNDGDHDYRLRYDDERLSGISDGDDSWTVGYDSRQRMSRIRATLGGDELTVDVQYSEGRVLGARHIPRLPLFVAYAFGLDGRPLAELDLLAPPDYLDDLVP